MYKQQLNKPPEPEEQHEQQQILLKLHVEGQNGQQTKLPTNV